MSPVERAVLAQQVVLETMAARSDALQSNYEDLRNILGQVTDVIELMSTRMDMMDAHIENLIERIYVLETGTHLPPRSPFVPRKG